MFFANKRKLCENRSNYASHFERTSCQFHAKGTQLYFAHVEKLYEVENITDYV